MRESAQAAKLSVFNRWIFCNM